MILASSGFPLQRCCIKCSPTLTGMFVVFLTGMFVVFLTVYNRECAFGLSDRGRGGSRLPVCILRSSLSVK